MAAVQLALAMVVVIGHRGASGYRPEHTLASYELAARTGADYLEPDLVSTADGELVCRHEPEIGGTTDVAAHPQFAARRTTKEIDGVPVRGWFAEDFTLAELRTLRVRERLAELRSDNTRFDGRYPIPTLDEVLVLRQALSASLGRPIGVYPETKHPTYFRAIGRPLEEPLLAALERHGLNHPGAPVFVQSFETGNLRRLRSLGLRTPVVQLMCSAGGPHDLELTGDRRGYLGLAAPAGLAEIAGYADGIGPAKGMVLGRRRDGSLGEPSRLVDDAHAAGLVVHPYTFRAENTFLPSDLRRGESPSELGDAVAELRAFLRAGVDGLFTDHPDVAVLARDGAAAMA